MDEFLCHIELRIKTDLPRIGKIDFQRLIKNRSKEKVEKMKMKIFLHRTSEATFPKVYKIDEILTKTKKALTII